MVRTADDALRVTGGKAERKGGSASVTAGRSLSTGSAEKNAGGLNPICPRETPNWQKPITQFFKQVEKPEGKNVTEDITMMDSEADAQPSVSTANNFNETKGNNQDQTLPDVTMEESCSNTKKTAGEEISEDEAQPRKKIKLD